MAQCLPASSSSSERARTNRLKLLGTLLIVLVGAVGLVVIMLFSSDEDPSDTQASVGSPTNSSSSDVAADPTTTPSIEDDPEDTDTVVVDPTIEVQMPTDPPTMAVGAYELDYLNGVQEREPTWEDWEYLSAFWADRIRKSTCPEEGSEELKTHWDYNYIDFLNDPNIAEEDVLKQDCTLFTRDRNPMALGSRLVRHLFHDCSGGFDGFLNVRGKETFLILLSLLDCRFLMKSHLLHICLGSRY